MFEGSGNRKDIQVSEVKLESKQFENPYMFNIHKMGVCEKRESLISKDY